MGGALSRHRVPATMHAAADEPPGAVMPAHRGGVVGTSPRNARSARATGQAGGEAAGPRSPIACGCEPRLKFGRLPGSVPQRQKSASAAGGFIVYQFRRNFARLRWHHGGCRRRRRETARAVDIFDTSRRPDAQPRVMSSTATTSAISRVDAGAVDRASLRVKRPRVTSVTGTPRVALPRR